MDIVDLLITIIAAATVVTLAIGAVAYLAYRLRRTQPLNREEESDDGQRYFVRYRPERRPGRED